MKNELDDDRKQELCRLMGNVIHEMTGDVFAARLEVGLKIIETMQEMGWIITPPQKKKPH